MTAIDTRESSQQAWSTMPGWSTVADLTPPELIEARRLKTLRKVIAYVLVAIVIVCAAGAVLAWRKVGPAEDALNQANARTAAISSQRSRYIIVTNLESAITSAQQQQTTLLSTDVDVAALIRRIRGAAGTQVTPSSVSLTLTPTGATTTPTSSGVATPSTATAVGTVTMSGIARHFTNVADFVTKLDAISGFDDVIPTSNSAASGSGGSASWNITLNLTDAIYSKRFVAPAPAVVPAAKVSGGSR